LGFLAGLAWLLEMTSAMLFLWTTACVTLIIEILVVGHEQQRWGVVIFHALLACAGWSLGKSFCPWHTVCALMGTLGSALSILSAACLMGMIKDDHDMGQES
jgi:hypothetical protein